MKELVIDGSFEDINLSIFDSEELVYNLHLHSKQTHSKILTDIFDYAFKSLSLHIDDIDKLYCCIGPGKYTSMRVVLATIKGMFFDKLEYAYCFTSLDLMATQQNKADFRLICETSKTKIYFADYIKHNNTVKRLGDIQSSTKEKSLETQKDIVLANTIQSAKEVFLMDSEYITRTNLYAITPLY